VDKTSATDNKMGASRPSRRYPSSTEPLVKDTYACAEGGGVAGKLSICDATIDRWEPLMSKNGVISHLKLVAGIS
jgi:hypothetical protein